MYIHTHAHTERYLYVYTYTQVICIYKQAVNTILYFKIIFKKYVSSGSIDQIYNTQLYTSLAVIFWLTLTLVNIIFGVNSRSYTTFFQVRVTLSILNTFKMKPVDFKQETEVCQFNMTTEKKKKSS